MNLWFIIIILLGISKIYRVNGEHNNKQLQKEGNSNKKRLCWDNNNNAVKCKTVRDNFNMENLTREEGPHLYNSSINEMLHLFMPVTIPPIDRKTVQRKIDTNKVYCKIKCNYPVKSRKTTKFPVQYKRYGKSVTNSYSFPPRYTRGRFKFNLNPFKFLQPIIKVLLPSVPWGKIRPTKTPQTGIFDKFFESLYNFERKFYKITFDKLALISPEDRRVNGMSFVQSGFLLQLTLLAFSLEVDKLTKDEIEKVLQFQASDVETIDLIRKFMLLLPTSLRNMKFLQASRLMLWPGNHVTSTFRKGAASALQLLIDTFNGNETPDKITAILNQKIEEDSAGAIRNTFDEDDVSGNITAIQMTTIYFRPQWRSAPTILNGTWPFYASNTLTHSVRMIKLNDVMGYANLKELNAEVLEIPYATPYLSLIILLPRSTSLRELAERVPTINFSTITARMTKRRIAVHLPIYTLRMTLLVPNKLQEMGINRLFEFSNKKTGDRIRISHMIQRIMFWAEAGRNAYKDDGLEWDEKPSMMIHINRPYLFFVRWHNITIMNGNFVL